MKIAIIASTAGAVMSRLLVEPFFRSTVAVCISDRYCPALEKARTHGIEAVRLTGDATDFSNQLLAYFVSHEIDYAILFYTKLLRGKLLHVYRDRLINLHPTLLPAFRGLGGADAALRSDVRIIGTTIHFIDERSDAGKIIIQSALPVPDDVDRQWLRHRLFDQQCRSLFQVVTWLNQGRIRVVGDRVEVRGASFDDLQFVPALDSEIARQLIISPALDQAASLQ